MPAALFRQVTDLGVCRTYGSPNKQITLFGKPNIGKVAKPMKIN
jgi:hypothetical protein